MVTEKESYRKGYAILREAKIADSDFDSRILFETAFGHRPVPPFTDSESDAEKEKRYLELCKRRAEGYPLQYIVGVWEFYSLPFCVDERVLIPRQDTEILVETAAKYIKRGNTVFDYCTGSGCVGITIAAAEKCKMTLFDISEGALEVAKKNAGLNKVKVDVKKLDVLRELPDKQADVIVCNPPYLTKDEMESLQKEVKAEPYEALYGGDDGLEFYRALAKLHFGALKIGGYFITEIGETQAEDVIKIFTENRFSFIEKAKDYSGNDRVLVFRNI